MPKKLAKKSLGSKLAEEAKTSMPTTPKCMWFDRKPCFNKGALTSMVTIESELSVCIICQLREINRQLFNMSK